MYFYGEPELATARGGSDLLSNARDCDRAGDVCMRVCWHCEPDARAGARRVVETPGLAICLERAAGEAYSVF